MSATEVLTGVLVLVTAYYAWQNQRMVGEMRRSRELSVLPKLAVDLRLQGPTFAQVQVLNVGPGPALAVDLRIAFEPSVDGGEEREERPWEANVVVPGDGPVFDPPDAAVMDAFTAGYKQVRVTGSMQSATGEHYDVEEVLDDLAGRWERLQASEQVLDREPNERITRQLERLERPLDKGVDELRKARQAMERLAPAPERPVRRADGAEDQSQSRPEP